MSFSNTIYHCSNVRIRSYRRHITLDRNMYGSDQKSSLSLDGFGRLIEMLNKIKITLGKKKNFVTAIEKSKFKEIKILGLKLV